MSDLVVADRYIPAMTDTSIAKVRALEQAAMQETQSELHTDHVLHGGQYTRTIKMPAGMMITGAQIKIATTLIVAGDCTVYIGDEAVRLTGYNVLAAGANRKQAFIVHSDTCLTMTFATKAKTIEEAENEFTDEAHLLLSRSAVGQNTVTITGE